MGCGAELSVAEPTCPACGWSYAGEEGEVVLEEQAAEKDEEDPEGEETSSTLDRLRSRRSTVF